MAKITINTREFNAALRKYAELSKRTLPEIINRKAYFIARRAVFETPKASRVEIRQKLGRISKRNGQLKLVRLSWAWRRDMPMAEAIIRARFHRDGKPQPTKDQVQELMIQLILARTRSIAYFKSGWLPAIQKLEAFVKSKFGAARRDRDARVKGRLKGNATPARPGWRPKATIENATGVGGKLDSGAKRGKALEKYGTPALQRAIDFETRGTLQEIDRRMKAAAKASGIRTN